MIKKYTKNAPAAKHQRPESASRACVIKSLFEVTINFLIKLFNNFVYFRVQM